MHKSTNSRKRSKYQEMSKQFKTGKRTNTIDLIVTTCVILKKKKHALNHSFC